MCCWTPTARPTPRRLQHSSPSAVGCCRRSSTRSAVGGGVPYADYAIHDLQAAFTRPVFVNNLTQDWLPALPDIHARLVAGEPLRIAEIGCGEGIASITLAPAFPAAVVHGFDLDEASIAAARRTRPRPAWATGTLRAR